MAQHLDLVVVAEGQAPRHNSLPPPLAAAATGAVSPAAFGALDFEWRAPRVFPGLASPPAGLIYGFFWIVVLFGIRFSLSLRLGVAFALPKFAAAATSARSSRQFLFFIFVVGFGFSLSGHRACALLRLAATPTTTPRSFRQFLFAFIGFGSSLSGRRARAVLRPAPPPPRLFCWLLILNLVGILSCGLDLCLGRRIAGVSATPPAPRLCH